MSRYPENTTTSLEDFRKCGWLEAIDEAKREDCSTWQALSSFARKAIEEDRFSEGKVLWLLSDACSMTLKPDSYNEPFKAFFVWADGNRSAIPEDFKTEDIALFEEIINEITEPKLRARIADLLWLLKKPKNREFALKAIDAYRETPLAAENWVRDEKCWERAIQLCMMLNAGSGTRLQEIETELILSIKNATKEDKFFTLKLSDLLAKYGQSNHQLEIAEKLEKLACEFEELSDFHVSREYFSAASDSYKRIKMLEKSAEMIVKVADGYVKEAIAHSIRPNIGNTMAAISYENAIQTYVKIPNKYKKTFSLDNKISELRKTLNSTITESLKEIPTASSGRVDISDLIEMARNQVTGKTIFDALQALANIYQGAKVQKVREYSRETLDKYPFSRLFSVNFLSKDGRNIAKCSAVNSDKELEDAVNAKMIQAYSMDINLVVQSTIWAALEIVRLEHRITESDFYSIVRNSPIVPEGRERLIAKGLFAGYDNDFVTALHILIPQFEHLVRVQLKQAGVITAHLDINTGIETENGLSTLMENPEVNIIFGEDLAFEFQALLCDAFGANLRNELAHGLIEYEECYSISSIYAWWLMLRIIFNTFWNAKIASQHSEDQK